MNDDMHRVWTKVVGSAALGAAAMFMMDPDKGRRRRALARDKARLVARRTAEVLDAATRDVDGRWQGMRARATQRVRHDDPSDDDVVRERIRARIGHVVSHPHALRVDARAGRVLLAGPILASEEAPLLEAVREVPGVGTIENLLERHESADGIPSLQGDSTRRGSRPQFVQQGWTPALRAGAVASGAFVALYGARRGGLTGALMAAVGLGVAARGAANLPLARIAGTTGARAIDVEKTIDISASPDAVFDMWTRYENFPQFMSHVKDVRDLGGGRSHWIVSGPAGTTIEWDSVITRMVAGRLIAWRSEPGSLVAHAGSARFDACDGGTRVTVRMSYNPGGGLGRALAAPLGGDPERKMDDDLMRMKTFVETGIKPRDAAQRQAENDLPIPEPDLPIPEPSGTPYEPMTGAASGPTMAGTAGA